MVIFYVVYQLGSTVTRMMSPTREKENAPWEREIEPMYFVWAGASLVGGLVFAITLTIVLMAVRKRVRVKDEIPAASCGDSEDCCCAFWCPCCTSIQILTQFGMRCENGYVLCSETGDGARVGPAV